MLHERFVLENNADLDVNESRYVVYSKSYDSRHALLFRRK